MDVGVDQVVTRSTSGVSGIGGVGIGIVVAVGQGAAGNRIVAGTGGDGVIAGRAVHTVGEISGVCIGLIGRLRIGLAGHSVVAIGHIDVVVTGRTLTAVVVLDHGFSRAVVADRHSVARNHVVAVAFSTVGRDQVIAGRPAAVGHIVDGAVGTVLADGLGAAGDGVVAAARDNGVVTRLGAVAAGIIIGVGVRIARDVQRVAGAQVVALAGIDDVVAGPAVVRGLVVGHRRGEERRPIGFDRQGIAGEDVVIGAGRNGVVAGPAVVARRVLRVGEGIGASVSQGTARYDVVAVAADQRIVTGDRAVAIGDVLREALGPVGLGQRVASHHVVADTGNNRVATSLAEVGAAFAAGIADLVQAVGIGIAAVLVGERTGVARDHIVAAAFATVRGDDVVAGRTIFRSRVYRLRIGAGPALSHAAAGDAVVAVA